MSVQLRLEQARYAMGRGVTQRRACTLMSIARSGLVYECTMPSKDGSVMAAMREYSHCTHGMEHDGSESFYSVTAWSWVETEPHGFGR